MLWVPSLFKIVFYNNTNGYKIETEQRFGRLIFFSTKKSIGFYTYYITFNNCIILYYIFLK